MSALAIVVFSDLVDSTALLARLGDDWMEGIRRSHVDDVAGVVDAAGGRLVKTLGDGTMASFDSALGALRAAAGIQVAVERLDAAHDGIGFAARVGVAAGEPIAHKEDLHGMAVVIASRLCSAAGSGEVLVQDLVYQLVASRDGVSVYDSGSYELKGVPDPVGASRLRWREVLDPSGRFTDDAGDERETATRALPGEVGSVSGADTAGVVGVAGLAGASGAAGDAGAVDRVPLPRLLAAYAEEPLIGRDREIGALRQATAPREGRRAVLVLGEPGIGKTRHAAATAADAHTRGELVVLARCPPEAVVPFEPWVRAIGELARAGGKAWRRELAHAAGPELSVLVPELSGYSVAPREQAGAGVVVAAEGARYRLLYGIAAVLEGASAQAPLHLVLDDAHWCDAASAQALGHLLQSAVAERLVLVVTARERELGRGHPVSRVLADMRRTRDLGELRLEGLDAGGTAALVAARIGRAITPRLAARIQARTAGNPFFAAELARDLEEQGALRDDQSLQDAPAPNAVTDLVEERLARLDPVTERLLVAVAAIGPSAPVSLAATAAVLSTEQADRAVQQALSERLVDEVPAARPTIAFPHALIREALAAGIDGAAQARLHLAIATALEDLKDAEPAELARHYGRAVAIAGPGPAIAAYRKAAHAAAEGHDHEQAAEHVRSALGLLAADDLQGRMALLLEQGEHELLGGDVYRARASFRDAAGAARRVGDAGALARAALGFAGGDISFGLETNSYDEQAVELLRGGLEALGDDDPLLALRICFRLSFALIYSDDEIALAALAARARELGRLLNDPESQLLARSTEVIAIIGRTSEPLNVLPRIVERFIELGELAEQCDREDLTFSDRPMVDVWLLLPRADRAVRASDRAGHRDCGASR